MEKNNKKLGLIICRGNEDGIFYKVYLNNDFLYTIVVKKEQSELIETHQGVRAICGYDALDMQLVNEKVDKMIEELKGN